MAQFGRLRKIFIKWCWMYGFRAKDQKQFEYLVSGHQKSIALLRELHRVIYPHGKYVVTSFCNYASSTLPPSAPFSFSDLGLMYAGIVGVQF